MPKSLHRPRCTGCGATTGRSSGRWRFHGLVEPLRHRRGRLDLCAIAREHGALQAAYRALRRARALHGEPRAQVGRRPSLRTRSIAGSSLPARLPTPPLSRGGPSRDRRARPAKWAAQEAHLLRRGVAGVRHVDREARAARRVPHPPGTGPPRWKWRWPWRCCIASAGASETPWWASASSARSSSFAPSTSRPRSDWSKCSAGKTARYRLRPRRCVSQEETFPLGVRHVGLLIGRGIRSGYGYEELPGTDAHAHLRRGVGARGLATGSPREMFRLPEREAAVLDSVTGKTTLARLLAQRTSGGASDPEEVLRAVFLGLACELLRSPKWVVPPSFIPGNDREVRVRTRACSSSP